MTRSQAAVEDYQLFARRRAVRSARREAELIRALAAVTLPGNIRTRPPLPTGYVDVVCHHRDEVHRVKIDDSEIPFAICPHDGQHEAAFIDSWSENARASYALLISVLNARYRDGSDHVLGILSTVSREIDPRPAEPLRDEDRDWGEADSLENVPRRPPNWTRSWLLLNWTGSGMAMLCWHRLYNRQPDPIMERLV